MENSQIEEPMYFSDSRYDEQEWRNDHDARERAEVQRDLVEMYDSEAEARADEFDRYLTARLNEMELPGRKPMGQALTKLVQDKLSLRRK